MSNRLLLLKIHKDSVQQFYTHQRGWILFSLSITPHLIKTWIWKEMASFLWDVPVLHNTLLFCKTDSTWFNIMKWITQAAFCYEYWSQWDLKLILREKRQPRVKHRTPHTKNFYKIQVSFQLKRDSKKRGRTKKKGEEKERNPTQTTQLS